MKRLKVKNLKMILKLITLLLIHAFLAADCAGVNGSTLSINSQKEGACTLAPKLLLQSVYLKDTFLISSKNLELNGAIPFEAKVKKAIEEQKKMEVDLDRGLWFYNRSFENLKLFKPYQKLPSNDIFVGFLKRMFKKSSLFIWADFGCGMAKQLQEVKHIFGQKISIYGVDLVNWNRYDAKNLSTAITGDSKEKDYIFLQQDIQDVQLPEKPDLITMVYVFPYLDNPLSVVVNAYNQLKTGGLLLVNLPLGGQEQIRLNGNENYTLREFIFELKQLGIKAEMTNDLANNILFMEKKDNSDLKLNLILEEVSYLQLTGMKEAVYSLKDKGSPLISTVKSNEDFLNFLLDKKVEIGEKISELIKFREVEIKDRAFLKNLRKIYYKTRENFLGSVLRVLLIRHNPAYPLKDEYKRMDEKKFKSLLKKREIKITEEMERFAKLLSQMKEKKERFLQENPESWMYPYCCQYLSQKVMEELKVNNFRVELAVVLSTDLKWRQDVLDNDFFGSHFYLIVNLDGEKFVLDFAATQFHKIEHHIFEETGIVIIPLEDVHKNPDEFFIYNMDNGKTEVKITSYPLPHENISYSKQEKLILKRIMGDLKFYNPDTLLFQKQPEMSDKKMEEMLTELPRIPENTDIKIKDEDVKDTSISANMSNYVFLPKIELEELANAGNIAARYYLSKTKIVNAGWYITEILDIGKRQLIHQILQDIQASANRLKVVDINKLINELFKIVDPKIDTDEGYCGPVSAALVKGLERLGYKAFLYETEYMSGIRKHSFATVVDKYGIEWIIDFRAKQLMDDYALSASVSELLYVSRETSLSSESLSLQKVSRNMEQNYLVANFSMLNGGDEIFSERQNKLLREILKQKHVSEDDRFIQIALPDGICTEAVLHFLAKKLKVLFRGDINQAYNFCLNKIKDFRMLKGIKINKQAILLLMKKSYSNLKFRRYGNWMHIYVLENKSSLPKYSLSPQQVLIEQAI